MSEQKQSKQEKKSGKAPKSGGRLKLEKAGKGKAPGRYRPPEEVSPAPGLERWQADTWPADGTDNHPCYDELEADGAPSHGKLRPQEAVSEFAACMMNRELSWLKFNERVLDEALCESTPLLERLKFVSIFTTNLDEFFMVRVGSLTDYLLFEPDNRDSKTGMTPAQQLSAVFAACVPLYARRDKAYEAITSALHERGLCALHMGDLKGSEVKFIERMFVRAVQPLLSPQIIDNRHPFPHIANKQLNIAVALERKGHRMFGIIPVPPMLERVVFTDKEAGRYVLIEEIILHFCEQVFDMYNVLEKTVLCLTRNADIDTDVGLFDEDIDYRKHMQKMLKKRLRLAPVRMETQKPMSPALCDYLCQKLSIARSQIFVSRAPLDLSYAFSLENAVPAERRRELINTPFTPQQSPLVGQRESVLQQVLRRDVLLSYPFESMKPFLDLIREAAGDESVISIKITLYRIASQSKLAEYLADAAENGKEVFVLMELRARFDEQNNIEWAQRLEEAGCRVIYGMDGFKVHSKICLITRKERGGVQYITQVGTGNYNEKTARLYTDLSIITANQEIGRDAAEFFKNMSIGNLDGQYNRLWVAPSSFRQNILRLMDDEIEKARAGAPAEIWMKCNSLTDKEVIEKLIEASRAGVRVRMVVRGICCMLPRVGDLTENITVVSIVGRFLEHSRIYCFGTGPERTVYISSGDMMTRNTTHRVEISCPILDPALRRRVLGMMEALLDDNVKARELFADGTYVLRAPGEAPPLNAQAFFMKQAMEAAAAPPPPPPKKTLLSGVKGFFSRRGPGA